jgi:hypothetical protein
MRREVAKFFSCMKGARLHTAPLDRNFNDLHRLVQCRLLARYAASPAASPSAPLDYSTSSEESLDDSSGKSQP